MPNRRPGRLTRSIRLVTLASLVLQPAIASAARNITVNADDTSIVYTPSSAWTVRTGQTPVIADGVAKVTSTNGAAATFTFHGTAIYFQTIQSSMHGIATIDLDGTDFKLNSSLNDDADSVGAIWGVVSLKDTEHTVTVTQSDTTGTELSVNAFVYTSTSDGSSDPSQADSNPFASSSANHVRNRVLLSVGLLLAALLLAAGCFFYVKKRQRTPATTAIHLAASPQALKTPADRSPGSVYQGSFQPTLAQDPPEIAGKHTHSPCDSCRSSQLSAGLGGTAVHTHQPGHAHEHTPAQTPLQTQASTRRQPSLHRLVTTLNGQGQRASSTGSSVSQYSGSALAYRTHLSAETETPVAHSSDRLLPRRASPGSSPGLSSGPAPSSWDGVSPAGGLTSTDPELVEAGQQEDPGRAKAHAERAFSIASSQFPAGFSVFPVPSGSRSTADPPPAYMSFAGPPHASSRSRSIAKEGPRW